MKLHFLGLLLCIAVGAVGANAETLPYLNDSIDIEVRVEDALTRLTLEEKIAIVEVHIAGCSSAWNTRPCSKRRTSRRARRIAVG